MTIKGKRIFNYRPVCFSAFFLMLGILLAEGLYSENPLFYIIPAVAFTASFVPLLMTKRYRRFVYIPLAFIVGVMSMSLSSYVYDTSLMPAYEGTFQARINDSVDEYYGDLQLTIDKITVDGVEYGHKAWLHISIDDVKDEYGNIAIDGGDYIEITGVIKPIEHTKFYTKFASDRAKGYAYTLSKVTSVKLVKKADAPFPVSFINLVMNNFDEWLDYESKAVTKALIFGDAEGIDNDLYSAIAATGLIHVLSVSGLHITTMITAVYFLLNKLKVNKKVSYFIAMGMAFIYVMLCNFVAPAIRALIMSGVYNFASAFGKKKDDMSALSLAAVLILVFRPLAIMELGFLLSFFCMLGIFVFNSTFEDAGMKVVCKISPKRKFGKRLVAVTATSFATNIMVYPLVAFYFKQVPTMFVLSNFIMLPYTMFLYLLDIVMTLLSLITTWGGFSFIIKYFTMPFTYFSRLISSLPFATIPVWVSLVWVVILPILMTFCSKYVFVRRATKVKVTLLLTSLGVAFSTLFLLV